MNTAFQASPLNMNTKQATVAIIMRSKDEQPHCDPTLAALVDQTYTDYKLYNIDSGSTDGTLEAVKRFNPDPSAIYEIAPEDYVPGKVLNMMVGLTNEPIVVLLNADAIPQDRYWLEKLVAPILEGRADAAMSRQIPRDEAYFIDKYDFERGYSPKTIRGNPDFFSAVSCVFKRELWEKNKFYTEGYAEDLAWSKVCREKGARFELVMDSVVEHSHNFSVKGLFKKRYRHGIAFVEIYQAQPNLAKQMYQCAKELARDLIYTLKKGAFTEIPYNILHRSVIHWAYYQGVREGVRRNSQKDQEVSA